MEVKTKSKSGLFLIELIITILFFSVASAVCVQVFVNAHLISEKSSNISMAVLVSQSAAEAMKGTANSEGVASCAERMGKLLGASVSKSGDTQVLTVGYDERWNRLATGAESRYQLTVTLSQSNLLVYGEIKVSRNSPKEELIYQLDVKKFLGNTSIPAITVEKN